MFSARSAGPSFPMCACAHLLRVRHITASSVQQRSVRLSVSSSPDVRKPRRQQAAFPRCHCSQFLPLVVFCLRAPCRALPLQRPNLDLLNEKNLAHTPEPRNVFLRFSFQIIDPTPSARAVNYEGKSPFSGHDKKFMKAMKLSFLTATAWWTSLVRSAVPLSSVADVDLREFAGTAAAAREEARFDGRDRELQPQRLSLRHLEAMWHTSLGGEVSCCTRRLECRLWYVFRPRCRHSAAEPAVSRLGVNKRACPRVSDAGPRQW